MRSLLLKLLNLLFPSEKPSESDRLNYYADQRCKTCQYRLQCVQEESDPDYTLSSAELEDIRQTSLTQQHAIPSPHGAYFLEHRKDYTIPLEETQRLPIERIRAVHEEMKRHGSIE